MAALTGLPKRRTVVREERLSYREDARAGGASEADEAGVLLDDTSDGLTHTNKKTSLRYIRRRTKKIAEIAVVRQQSRAAGDEGKVKGFTVIFGRGSWIRTNDLQYPKLPRYQAALYPEYPLGNDVDTRLRRAQQAAGGRFTGR